MDAHGVRIAYRRSGGLAGIDLAAEVQSDELPAEQTDLVRQLLIRPPTTAPGPGNASEGADQFSYTLGLDDGTRHQTFRWTERDVPEDVQPLLTALHQRARPAPPA
jgi:hypothetical protein